MQVLVVGVKRTVYKDKNEKEKVGFNISGLKDYTAYELESSECQGQDIIREWSNTDFGVCPGDEVDFIYEPGYHGKATLVNVKMIKQAGNPFVEEKEKKPADKAVSK